MTFPDLIKTPDQGPASGGEEAQADHTGLFRMTLALEDGRAYWENFRDDIPPNRVAAVAFEERWFGNKSMQRTTRMISDFRRRFDAYPHAFDALRRWRPRDLGVCRNICHWHLQLSDPIYRDLTTDYFEKRRQAPAPVIDRDVIGRWLQARVGDRWAPATRQKMARNLLTAAAEAGLCSTDKGTRALMYPTVSDVSLEYLLYCLRQIDFSGRLSANPYLTSVGLGNGAIDRRLHRLSGLRYQRAGDVHDFNWGYPDIQTWAESALFLDAGAGQ